jgi:hypothetical protein
MGDCRTLAAWLSRSRILPLERSRLVKASTRGQWMADNKFSRGARSRFALIQLIITCSNYTMTIQSNRDQQPPISKCTSKCLQLDSEVYNVALPPRARQINWMQSIAGYSYLRNIRRSSAFLCLSIFGAVQIAVLTHAIRIVRHDPGNCEYV